MFKSKLLCSILSSILILTLVCSFSFSSSAASLSFNMPFAEPQLDPYSGYIAMNYIYDGNYHNGVFYWRFTPSSGIDSGYSNINITIDSYGITFSAREHGYFIISNMRPDGTVSFYSALYTDTPISYGFHVNYYSVYGNVTTLIDHVHASDHDSVNVIWGSDDTHNAIVNIYSQIQDLNNNLGGKLDSVLSSLNTLINNTSNSSMYLEGIHYWLIYEFMPTLTTYMDSYNLYMLQIDETLTSIHSQIQCFLEMSDADKEVVEQYQEQQKQQQDFLKEAAEESQLERPDLDVGSTINSNIDFNGIYLYGQALSSVTSHPIVITMLLIVFTMALIAYILFGKKG